MRLIDGNRLVKETMPQYKELMGTDIGHGMGMMLAEINAAPTIDAVHVVHGRWEWNGKCWECSNCRCNRFHDLVLGLDAAYCGRCGARMDGDNP